MASVQVRNVECLISGRNNEEDKTEQNENQTKPQNTQPEHPTTMRHFLGRTFSICVYSEVKV